MIVYLDTPQCLDACAKELGGMDVEQLFTPLTRRAPQRPEAHFAMDNGAFSRFEPDAFRRMLEKHRPRRDLCRFVPPPDVVGDARRTLEIFNIWRHEMAGWPLALVCQNGQEHLPIPWGKIAAVFIGGDTGWKCGPGAAAIIKAAKALEKWVHVGRVNTPNRFDYFKDLEADSIDGTGLARYSHMREAVAPGRIAEPSLNLET